MDHAVQQAYKIDLMVTYAEKWSTLDIVLSLERLLVD
jgi:hypothetical protein